MMGPRQVEQAALFYNFSLEARVPHDHILRSIDRFVVLSDLRRQLAPFYSETGRPSVDPELMIRMLIIGYCLGIRSERRLCEEVHLNLAYRWFWSARSRSTGPGPLDVFEKPTRPLPRERSFAPSNSVRDGAGALHRTRFCGGEGFAVVASLIKADANRQKGIEGAAGLPPDAVHRATQEYLA